MQLMLMGNFSLFPFLLKYRNNAMLGTEETKWHLKWAQLVAGGHGTKSELIIRG